MKHYIILTMIISTILFWIIFFITFMYGYILQKRSIEQYSYEEDDLYGKLCLIFNLLGGFLLFELFSFVIAVFIKSIILNVILHFPAWYISMWTAHRILPHIVNRLVEIFVDSDE